MRTIKIIALLFCIFLMANKTVAQAIQNDTIVFIVDTAKSYIRYTPCPFPKKDTTVRWKIDIEGHYYDNSKYSNNKNFASIRLSTPPAFRLRSHHISEDELQIKIDKRYFLTLDTTMNDEWLNKQTDLNKFIRKFGDFPFDKYYYVVFNQDLKNSEQDSIIMHRVEKVYNSVKY